VCFGVCRVKDYLVKPPRLQPRKLPPTALFAPT
jgi:hypothetical protein